MYSRKLFPLSRLFLVLSLLLALMGIQPALETSQAGTAAEPPPPPEDKAPAVEVLPPTPPAPPTPHTIYLKSREFQPGQSDLASLQKLTRADRGRIHILVQLDFIPRQAAKDELKARGLELLAYVPDYAWIASVPANNPASAMQLPGVTWAGELTVEDKLDPAIQKGEWGSWNFAPDGMAAVYVAMHLDETLDTGRQLVAAHGGKVTGEAKGTNLLIVEMPSANVRTLAAQDAIQWIEPAEPPLGEGNDGIRQQIGVNTVQAAPYSLDGTGVDVLVYDGGQVGAHTDFGTRLTIGAGDASGVSEHSTHVAGTVGGSGDNSVAQGGTALQWRGMAPNVDLISYGYQWDGVGFLFYNNPGDIEADWAAAQNTYGADLGTASLTSNVYKNYTSDCWLMGNYGTTSVLVDQMARGGNSTVGMGDKYISTWCNGNERNSPGSCSNTYSSISPPAAAKNPIHVGASNTNNNTIASFSSWGPTDDGRIKPSIVAGGCQTTGDLGITSTDNNPVNDYTSMCGCSMATPAVAGSLALMLQHYRDVYNTSGNFWPSTAKAILMHTADDLGNPGPDYQWGYGQVDIQAAVDLISRKAFVQDSGIAQGAVKVYYFIVPTNTVPAQVTLVWDDFEATFNANPTLINNLNLELVAPSGTIWRPWILDPANPANNATRGTDNRNNQEQVETPTPEIGTWLVRVRGTTVPQGPQDYTLVCEGCKALNLGVCQSKVDGTTMALSLPQAQGPALGEEEDVLTTAAPAVSPEALTAGELWQRSLEAKPDDTEQVQTALETLEAARNAGPEAVVALRNTLTGRARDLAMDDIQQAQERLAQSAPPPPPNRPVSPEEESARLQAQQAIEAANRAQALTDFDDPNEAKSQASIPEYQFSSPNGPAADRTVGNGCTYATIAAAISAASPGDRLLIEGGRTFTENLTVNKNLTLQGGYNGCASASTARTTINGNASGSAIVVNRSLTVTLQNLNVTRGNTGYEGGGIQFAWGDGTGLLTLTNVDVYSNTGQWGGGLWVGQNAQVVGTNVNVYSNTATSYGGGVRLFGGRATFTSTDIYDNAAPLGGGVYATKESGFASSLDLPFSTDVYNNRALTGLGQGGGIYMREGNVSLGDSSDLHGNSSIDGGGAYLVTSTLTIRTALAEIDSNTATGNGGGVYAQGSTVNLDDDAELYSNDAGTDGSGSGGGAYLDNSNLYGDKASIRYNTANDFGGGVYATNGSLVDMDLGGYACSSVRCSQLSYNTATNLYGGGIYARDDSPVHLNNIFVENNTADMGGGVYAYITAVYADNNLFARNDATSGTGDGIRLFTSASLSGSGNTLAYNNAGGASTGQAIGISGGSLTLGCSIVWGHSSSIDATGQNVTYSDIQGGYAGSTNLDVNPLFVAPGSQDYHLQNTSPVIDRCVSSSGPDFENQLRPIVRTTAASPYDMGADEVAGVDRVGIGGACTYGTIQQAVNAANDGDTIRVAAGVYFENVDITAGKTITIEGDYNSTCTATGGGATRVEGSLSSDNTFYISGGTVRLRNLQVAWGSGTGAGIDVDGNGQVTLDNADVLNNHGDYGGGIWLDTGSVVTITNGSEIHDNTATYDGGGARVWGKFLGYSNDSDTHNNCAPNGGGLSVPDGHLYLNAADVYGNQAADPTGKGGGIHVSSSGAVTLTNAAFVYFGNTAYDGAGIYADDATVYLDGVNTTLRDNMASHYGGGVYLTNHSTLTSNRSSIGQAGSGLANEAMRGAGIYALTSTVNFEGSIINNIASDAGAGLYAEASTVNLTNATVGGTGANEPNQLGVNGNEGVGLFLSNNTRAILSNTVVASNTFQTTGYTYGGGALVQSGSALTLTNSRIERHLAPSTSGGRGAGIYLRDAAVTLDNSQIISNTAGAGGGGVRLWSNSTLNVKNGSSLINNYALSGNGGAISATGLPTITISDSTLQSNTAGTDGGAIYLDAGTLGLTGWWDVQSNHAAGNGGAVAIAGTGDAGFNVTGGAQQTYLATNRADGDGGALYVTNNAYVQLYATGSYPLNLKTNRAGVNGGAAYANGGATFDLYGLVNANGNQAVGNGGVFYLSGSSSVWLDDWYNTRPQIWSNQAQNGGVVYAQAGSAITCDGADVGTGVSGNSATAGSGGAFYLSDSTLTDNNCVLRDNQATLNGGAIAGYTSTLTIDADYLALAAAMGAVDRFSPSAPQATGCDPLAGQCSSLYGNRADSDTDSTGDGGAIYSNGSTLTVNYSYLYRNSAYRGGAIYQEGAGAVGQVNNTLIYSNTVSIPLGAGIRNAGGAFTITHATLAGNVNGAGYSQGSGSGSGKNSIAWGNTNASAGFVILGGTFTYTCNIVEGGGYGANVNPQFVAPGAGENYHLQSSSPAVNACVSGLPNDLDNVARPFGGGYDMGAYEYAYAIALAPSNSGSGLPSSVVMYTHTLTNVGGIQDTYTLTARSSQGWGVTLNPLAPVMLDAAQFTRVTATISIPAGAPVGMVDVTVITATSKSDPNLSVRVTDTTTVTCESVTGVDFWFAPMVVPVGQAATFTGSVTGGTTPITYTWDWGDGSSVQSGNPLAHTFPLAATEQTYTVTLTVANTCSSPQVMRAITILPHYIYLPMVMKQ